MGSGSGAADAGSRRGAAEIPSTAMARTETARANVFHITHPPWRQQTTGPAPCQPATSLRARKIANDFRQIAVIPDRHCQLPYSCGLI
jgi:hypothetical protein